MKIQSTQKGMTTLVALIVVILLVVVGFVWTKDSADVEDVEGTAGASTVVQYVGVLADVTDGEVVRNIHTDGKSTGLAQAVFTDGAYELTVAFENLPEPDGTDFYEGWIVRKGLNFDVISSGKLEKVDGFYVNEFTADEDLTDHDFYVLTIEPDDGDPAPADHILEGTLEIR